MIMNYGARSSRVNIAVSRAQAWKLTHPKQTEARNPWRARPGCIRGKKSKA